MNPPSMDSSEPKAFGACFRLTLLTAEPELAAAADAAGVDRVGVDVEQIGKATRQRARPGARLSAHRLEDLAALRPKVRRAKLFCRLDPPHPGGRDQIERALDLGATCLMLPYFREVDEAAAFVDAVDGRAEVILLAETAAAFWRVEALAALGGVDEIMVGLNDLTWDCGMNSQFELLAAPPMEAFARTVAASGKRLGLGGLGRTDDESLPIAPELIYAQYPRLGAQSAWLARSFTANRPLGELAGAIVRLRGRLDHWARQDAKALEAARKALSDRINPRR